MPKQSTLLSALLCEAVVWICPVCDWMVSSAEIEATKIDLDCPGCGVRNLSDFEPFASPFGRRIRG